MSDRTEIPLEGLLDGYESALSGLGYSVSTKLARNCCLSDARI